MKKVKRLAKRIVSELEPIKEFKTARGSSYLLYPDFSTQRNRAGDITHTPGLQPKSQRTFYLSPSEKNTKWWLTYVQAIAPYKWAVIASTDQTKIAAIYLDGDKKGQIIPNSEVLFEKMPEVGLHPLEVWQRGRSCHIGTLITEVKDLKSTSKKSE